MRLSAGQTHGGLCFPEVFLAWRSPLSASASRRYFFVVEEDNTPLSVTVTPCDAPLEWTLSLQELPEAASGEGSGKRREAYDTHSPP